MWEITKCIVGYDAEQYELINYPSELKNLACHINEEMSVKTVAADLEHEERGRVLGDQSEWNAVAEGRLGALPEAQGHGNNGPAPCLEAIAGAFFAVLAE